MDAQRSCQSSNARDQEVIKSAHEMFAHCPKKIHSTVQTAKKKQPFLSSVYELRQRSSSNSVVGNTLYQRLRHSYIVREDDLGFV